MRRLNHDSILAGLLFSDLEDAFAAESVMFFAVKVHGLFMLERETTALKFTIEFGSKASTVDVSSDSMKMFSEETLSVKSVTRLFFVFMTGTGERQEMKAYFSDHLSSFPEQV